MLFIIICLFKAFAFKICSEKLIIVFYATNGNIKLSAMSFMSGC